VLRRVTCNSLQVVVDAADVVEVALRLDEPAVDGVDVRVLKAREEHAPIERDDLGARSSPFVGGG
jgi:hypothetical protein